MQTEHKLIDVKESAMPKKVNYFLKFSERKKAGLKKRIKSLKKLINRTEMKYFFSYNYVIIFTQI